MTLLLLAFKLLPLSNVHAYAGTPAIAGTYAFASTHDVAGVSLVVCPAVAGFRVRILKGIPSCHGAYLRNNGAWER